jgi:hypothetical protein
MALLATVPRMTASRKASWDQPDRIAPSAVHPATEADLVTQGW